MLTSIQTDYRNKPLICALHSEYYFFITERLVSEETRAASGSDVGRTLVQELRKRCLLTELCFLCDN